MLGHPPTARWYPYRPDLLRAADADRRHVADRLRLALDEGRLTLDEYDHRVQAVWTARTYAQLGWLTADLPPTGFRTAGPPPPAPRPGDTIGTLWTVWAVVAGVTVSLWLLGAVAGGESVPFWPAWLLAPTAGGLLPVTLRARARRRRAGVSPGPGGPAPG